MVPSHGRLKRPECPHRQTHLRTWRGTLEPARVRTESQRWDHISDAVTISPQHCVRSIGVAGAFQLRPCRYSLNCYRPRKSCRSSASPQNVLELVGGREEGVAPPTSLVESSASNAASALAKCLPSNAQQHLGTWLQSIDCFADQSSTAGVSGYFLSDVKR